MEVIMPQLGETVAEGTVTKWHKKVGDTVKADEMLFDVDSVLPAVCRLFVVASVTLAT